MRAWHSISLLLVAALAGAALPAPAQSATEAFNKLVREMGDDYDSCARVRGRAARKQAYIDHGKRSTAAWEGYLKEYPDSKYAFQARLNLAQALQMAKEKRRAIEVAAAAAEEAKNFFQIKEAAHIVALVNTDSAAGWAVIEKNLKKVDDVEMRAQLQLLMIKYIAIPKELSGRKARKERSTFRRERFKQVVAMVAKTYPGTEAGRLAAMMYRGVTLKVGEAAVNLKMFKDQEGRPLDLEALKGKVVLLHFWTGRARATRRYMTKLVALYKQLQPKGLAIVGINADYSEDRAYFEEAVEKYGIPWPNYHDGEKLDNKICRVYYVRRFPFNIIIGRDGKVLRIGEDTADLEDVLPELVARS